MKIIERENIDSDRWNKLVKSTDESSFFSYAWYLDAVAENWCILVSDDYSCGIALPFSIRLGVETLYTPIFVRYVEVLGEGGDFLVLEKLIKARFANISLATKQKLFSNSSKQVYQLIGNNTDRNIGSQAKRMLKKASKSNFNTIQHIDYKLVTASIKEGLENKYKGLTTKSMQALEQLLKNAENENALNVYQIDKFGGIVCLQDEYKILYLKGAVDDTTKKNGGMYLALNTAIEEAKNNDKIFDFGGSRVEGVRRFNINLGGKDAVYYAYKNLNYPWWYRLAKRIR